MCILITVLLLSPCFLLGVSSEQLENNDTLLNSSDPNQDMYVIHAMVYQVGIITNKTDNETNNFNTGGQQETVTFYHTNGTNINLSAIPTPILTNVTAQSMIGVAPTNQSSTFPTNVNSPWSTWDHLANVPADNIMTDKTKTQGSSSLHDITDVERKSGLHKRALNYTFKRGVDENQTPVRIVNGAAVIPPEAGVQSVALPPLLALNNNFSQIPVPIPNTSVVHYAKINTLVHMP